MEFLKANQIKLNSAGYLVSTETNKPVTHPTFVAQQRAAEYTVKLAEAIKDKTFTASKVDNLEEIKREVLRSINETQQVKYVAEPTKPVSAANEELIKYALDFVSYTDEAAKVDTINSLMAQFNCINDVEQVGEYFEEGLTKLNKIYTIEEILAAVKINVKKLG